MRRLLSLLPFVPFVAIACTVSANVGDLGGGGVLDAAGDAPPGSDGGLTDALAADSAVNGEGGPDADPAPIDAGCGVTFGHRGGFVDVGIVMGPTPNLTGGTIVAGMYELTALRVYFTGAESGTMQVRETMRVRGSTTAGAFDRLTEAQNATGSFHAYPLHGETHTFQTGAGPGIFVKPECPTEDFETSGRFDAKGDTLTLFDSFELVERVYRRVE